jgi:hypothetical protein
MVHALVPTRLPLPEFYRELATLYRTAVPLYRVLPALCRFGLHGMLLRMKLFGEFLRRVQSFHQEY